MTLPETLRMAMTRLRPGIGLANSINSLDDDAWQYVRAELLRLARENAELHKSALGGYEDGWHALRNERDALRDELAKLKARIEAAPVVVATRNGIVRTYQYHEYPSRARVRLLVQESNAPTPASPDCRSRWVA